MARLLDPGPSRDGKLRTRNRLFASMPEAFQEGGQDSKVRLRIGIYPLSRESRFAEVDANSGRMFDDFICTMANISFNEASQVMPSVDGDKIYAFDQLIPQITLTGFVYDSDKTIVDTELDVTFDGQGYAKWQRFYEEARISQIAKSQQIVRLHMHGMVMEGAFVGRNATHDSANQNKYDIVATFLIANMYNETTGSRVLTDLLGTNDPDRRSGIAGFLTLEGAQQVGLVDGLLADPSPNQVFLSALPSAGSVAGSLARGLTVPSATAPRSNSALLSPTERFRDI